MDTAPVRLADLTPENTEVVGFNGKLVGHCGYSLPIIKHKPTGLCCVLSLKRKPTPAWSSEAEIREMEAAGRITLFTTAEKLPTDWSPLRGEQPVVAWLSAIPLRWSRYLPKWLTEKQQTGVAPLTVCATQALVEDAFTLIVALAQANFDEMLLGRHSRWDHLSEIAEVGLQAARDLGQRYWMYVRCAVALYYQPGTPPECAYQVFRGAVEPTYRGATWPRFLEAMGVVYERAKHLGQEAKSPSSLAKTASREPRDAWQGWSVHFDLPELRRRASPAIPYHAFPSPYYAVKELQLEGDDLLKFILLHLQATGTPLEEFLNNLRAHMRGGVSG